MHTEPTSEREVAGFSEAADTHSLAGLAGIPHIHQPALLRVNRTLLERTCISSEDEEYFWMKTQYQTIKRWHILHTGWHLERRNNLFSLMRQPGTMTVGYNDGKSVLQTPRDFVYVVWILWYAVHDEITRRGNGQLFLLIQMLERLTEEWREQSCLDLLKLEGQDDISSQSLVLSNRRSMARALNYLQEIKCLKELDGQTDIWVEQGSPVLYQFTNAIHLLIMSLDHDAYQGVISHQNEANIFSPNALAFMKEKISPLKRAWRALLIGPFLLKFDDPEAFAALLENIEEIRNEADATFGWSLEVNHDYACIIRNRDSSHMTTGNLFNKKAAIDQLILLLCTAIREQVNAGAIRPDYYGRISTTVPHLLDLLAALRRQYESNWGKGIREKGNKELLSEILKRMHHIGFTRGPDDQSNVLILPSAARYSTRYVEEMPIENGQYKKQRGQKDFQQVKMWFDHEEILEE